MIRNYEGGPLPGDSGVIRKDQDVLRCVYAPEAGPSKSRKSSGAEALLDKEEGEAAAEPTPATHAILTVLKSGETVYHI